MMTYFQNPHKDDEYISWNGSSTFHVGYFDRCFIPTDVFTHYGAGEPGGRCTPTEAEDIAEQHFVEAA